MIRLLFDELFEGIGEMPEKQENNGLHLPDLTIKGFRGIKDLSLPRLGRVTLLAGKNGVGKTTVLEAVSIFASRGRELKAPLHNHDELSNMLDDDGKEFLAANIDALFHGREASENSPIIIGPSKESDQLKILKDALRYASNKEKAIQGFRSILYHYTDFQWFEVKFQDGGLIFPGTPRTNLKGRPLPQGSWSFVTESNLSEEIQFETLGPGLLDNDEIARFWDKIALTDGEEHAVDALRLIFGNKVERIALTAEEFKQHGRRVIVKLKDHSQPVPLKSLGDGAVRLFSVALALANSRDGILLIDEAENGIHHSVQRNFWRMVLRMARENNTQVLATTHSWDCVRGFAQAATDDEDAEGILFSPRTGRRRRLGDLLS